MIDSQLKQRLVGAVVLIALGVIIIPLLLDGDYSPPQGALQSNIPPPPHIVSLPPPRVPLPTAASTGEDDGNAAVPLPTELDQPPGEPAPREAPAVVQELATPATEVRAPPKPAATPRVAPRSPPKQEAEVQPAQLPSPAKVVEPRAAPLASAPRSRGPSRPAKRSRPAAITAWVVQVGRFSTEANATALRDKLRGSGYASFAEPDYKQGAKSVRVLVGPELQRADAETLRAQLKQRLKLDAFVVSYP